MVGRYGFLAFAAAMLLLPLMPVPEFWINQSLYIGLYAIVALGLVLLTGIAGLTSFGQAAFVGIGAYTAAYLSVNLGLSPWLTLAAGVGLALVSALFLGAVTLRMSGQYLPLATIAWGLVLSYAVANVDGLGKYDGILGVPPLSIAGVELGSARGLHGLVWAMALVCALAAQRLLDSRVGRAIRAVKSGSTMVEAMGISTFRYKLMVFVLAAILAALSGWLFAYFQRSVSPSPFTINRGIEYLIVAVLGGVGHVWGAFLGAAVVRLADDELQVLLPKLLGTSGNFEIVVFGIALVVMLRFAPEGLWAVVTRLRRAPARRRDWEGAAPLPSRDRRRRGDLLLQVDQIRKVFGGLAAVNEVSFEIRVGEVVGLIGPNGAGKSTTFNLISGVLPVTSGTVLFDGQPIHALSSREIARLGMSRTFQHVKLVPEMTVLENVALGGHMRSRAGGLRAMLRLDRAEERQLFAEAEQQLARIGLAGVMHEPAGNLALGPQRLVEIARALATDPMLLLLDEPAAGLRHKEKEALGDVLRQLKAQGLSILLVEHDMDFVMGLTDRIVVMEFGTKLMEGAPAEVQSSPAVRTAYLGAAL